ncbi:hypothetical protein [Rhodococcus qingshengii]|uniref:hypothetical protein n=1 Tax=Rhodococcus qingshengii TaxID=334542 RepID=UPI00287FD953|nr:hypothetical protein [Rhodococcus qingshengii]
MSITIEYVETRMSAVSVDREEIRVLLCQNGQKPAKYYMDCSESELIAELQDELTAGRVSEMPTALEPLVDNVAEISHRAWTVTVR